MRTMNDAKAIEVALQQRRVSAAEYALVNTDLLPPGTAVDFTKLRQAVRDAQAGLDKLLAADPVEPFASAFDYRSALLRAGKDHAAACAAYESKKHDGTRRTKDADQWVRECNAARNAAAWLLNCRDAIIAQAKRQGFC